MPAADDSTMASQTPHHGAGAGAQNCGSVSPHSLMQSSMVWRLKASSGGSGVRFREVWETVRSSRGHWGALQAVGRRNVIRLLFAVSRMALTDVVSDARVCLFCQILPGASVYSERCWVFSELCRLRIRRLLLETLPLTPLSVSCFSQPLHTTQGHSTEFVVVSITKKSSILRFSLVFDTIRLISIGATLEKSAITVNDPSPLTRAIQVHEKDLVFILSGLGVIGNVLGPVNVWGTPNTTAVKTKSFAMTVWP